MVERGHASNRTFRIAPEGVAVGEVYCIRPTPREGLVTCPRSRALCMWGTIKSLQPTNEVTRPGYATITPTVSMESQLLVKILIATIRRISLRYRPVNYGKYDVADSKYRPKSSTKSGGSESEYKRVQIVRTETIVTVKKGCTVRHENVPPKNPES
jgi:hypothetical protein